MFLIAGDSNSAGSELAPGDLTYGEIIANYFDLPFANIAVGGYSNAAIYRTTQNWISLNGHPKFVLIGWTSWEREEWYHKNEWHQILFGNPPLDEELHQRYKQWIVEVSQENIFTKSVEWHDNIYKLHLMLNSRRIPHLFFNCYFEVMLEPFHQRNWNHRYYIPYDKSGCYFNWCISQGISPTQNMHMKANGHRLWAENLIQYIKKHDLICQR